MRKILVFGSSGSGKSSLATLLGERLHLPVFHLDRLFWLPGWIERPKQEMAIDVEKILGTKDSWIIDGNYKRVVLESRIAKADLILLLDFNRLTCIYRALKRNLIHYNKTRPDMKDGCKEKLFPDIKFIKYIWNYRKSTLVPIEKIISKYPEKILFRFNNQKELDLWLKNKN